MLLSVKKIGSRYRAFRDAVKTRIAPKLQGAHDPLHLRVADFKKSDTLYVMGSGSSIHDLPPEAWRLIRASDSLGINFWLYHEHVPTWHFCEVSREAAEAESLMALLKMRMEDYRHTCIMLKDVMKLDDRFPRWSTEFPLGEASHLYTLASLGVRGRTAGMLRFFLRWYRRLGYFRRAEVLWGVPMKRATIFMTMCFGLMAGYKRIVLCGVDMSNTDYFYHHPKYTGPGMPKPPTLPVTAQALAEKYSGHGVKMRQSPNPSIHNTIDPALNPLPMDEVIHAFNEEVLKPEGVELFVALPSSKLYPRIPALFEPVQPSS
jgi:hypothetical protein